ncbi:hypothetical protein G9A89_011742 [Geosiphon pyriformis]|nr:hypothetical protein G9A89_011742 [Geosiphon pyriformis]
MASSVPDPPSFFVRYSEENLALLEQLKKYKGTKEEALNAFKAALPTEFDIFDLEPPKPIPQGNYELFGITWQVISQNATIKDTQEGPTQLFPEGEFDRVDELQRLKGLLLEKFCDLLGFLAADPFDSNETEKISEELKNIFMNIKQLLNEYRPHLSREILKLLMEQQLKERKQATAEARRRCFQLTQMLEAVKYKWQLMDETKIHITDDIPVGQFPNKFPQNSPSTSYNLTPETTNQMLQIIDSI